MTAAPPDIGTIRGTLATCATATCGQPIHARAFVAWATKNAEETTILLGEITDAKGAQRSPAHGAAAGYAVAMSTSGAVEMFVADLDRLRQRAFFERKPYGHEVDGLVLLGLALGVKTLGEAGVAGANWLSGLITRAVEVAPTGEPAGFAWTAFGG